MPAAPPRRLNLLDGMILMAGMGACLLLTRLYCDEYYPPFAERLNDYHRWASNWTPTAAAGAGASLTRYLVPIGCIVAEGVKLATLWLGMFSPIVLLLRLRRPRPAWRRLIRQPGTVATLTATLAAALAIALWTIASALAGQGPGLFFYKLAFARFLTVAGAAIALAWTCQRLGGRWAPEPSLVDRAGRLLGLIWIVAFLLLAWADFQDRILIDRMSPFDYYFISRVRQGMEG